MLYLLLKCFLGLQLHILSHADKLSVWIYDFIIYYLNIKTKRSPAIFGSVSWVMMSEQEVN